MYVYVCIVSFRETDSRRVKVKCVDFVGLCYCSRSDDQLAGPTDCSAGSR